MQEYGWKLVWKPSAGKDTSGGAFENVAAGIDNKR